MLAWHAANVLQPHLKRGAKLRPGDLLGERDKATATPMVGIFDSKESIVEALKEQRAARERARREAEED